LALGFSMLKVLPMLPLRGGELLSERIPPAGLMILRDSNPGESGVTLSPRLYHCQQGTFPRTHHCWNHLQEPYLPVGQLDLPSFAFETTMPGLPGQALCVDRMLDSLKW